MPFSDLLLWLSACPVLDGEPLNLSYLPGYSGWSLAVAKSSVKIDILGSSSRVLELKITRRMTVQSSADRLALVSGLEDLADWARRNPPPGSRLRVTGVPEFASRSNSGTEDFVLTVRLEEFSWITLF